MTVFRHYKEGNARFWYLRVGKSVRMAVLSAYNLNTVSGPQEERDAHRGKGNSCSLSVWEVIWACVRRTLSKAERTAKEK